MFNYRCTDLQCHRYIIINRSCARISSATMLAWLECKYTYNEAHLIKRFAFVVLLYHIEVCLMLASAFCYIIELCVYMCSVHCAACALETKSQPSTLPCLHLIEYLARSLSMETPAWRTQRIHRTKRAHSEWEKAPNWSGEYFTKLINQTVVFALFLDMAKNGITFAHKFNTWCCNRQPHANTLCHSTKSPTILWTGNFELVLFLPFSRLFVVPDDIFIERETQIDVLLWLPWRFIRQI